MCGILGLLGLNLGRDQLTAITSGMADELRHRGPDARGFWFSKDASVAFGHCRLSILDLSERGSQPMVSSDRRYVITFNGEIYNFLRLKAQLSRLGHLFHGGSDTEVLLAAICEWGIENAIQKAEGMFALGIWDSVEQRLTLARDRIGEKPLYYGWIDGTFVFASELKAIRRVQKLDTTLDRDALSLYVRHGYIPAPYSIYKGVRKLPPGTMLEVSPSSPAWAPVPRAYWSPVAFVNRASEKLGEDEVCERFETLLMESVKGRMIADVPVGAFLSGGIDSSLIVAAMQQVAGGKVRTFSIGFSESGYDEAPYAKRIAKHLGTTHLEHYVTDKEALDTIPTLPTIYDEPFADSSQIPTYLVSSISRRFVTVALSGDGGDELFGGYTRHLAGARVDHFARSVPDFLNHARSAVFTLLSKDRICDFISVMASTLGNRSDRWKSSGLQRLYSLLASRNMNELVKRIVSPRLAGSVVRGASHSYIEPFEREILSLNGVDTASKIMLCDLVCYLPDDILVKVDRASMRVSLEVRTPFLSHELVEFALGLPLHYKLRDGRGKWLVRKMLYKYVPPEMVDRPKKGFSVPLARWLRGTLRDWAEDLLDAHVLENQNVFHPGIIRRRWEEHVTGKANWDYFLWAILMFQSWIRDTR